MRIAQINTYDVAGGAERISRELHEQYTRRGHDSWLLVGCKRGDGERVVEIPSTAARGAWARAWARLADAVAPLGHDELSAAWRVRRAVPRAIGEPDRALARALGHEDYDYPGSASLPSLLPRGADVIHAHNLHGGVLADRGYFDLRLLPELSRRWPFVLTLHDAWLLSGHCAHSFDCGRWEHGCGECPDLTIYPAVKRDGTAYNWRRKHGIYAESRLHVATPCDWLMRKVERSMLRSGLAETRVIPYGVDLSVFRPRSDTDTVRVELGLPRDARILLLAANGIRQNEWKDYRTLRTAVSLLAERTVVVALGENAQPERIGPAEICFVPFEHDPAKVAAYYQAADLYVHAALAETFPNAILEALACGVPVVASSVGGVPEQIKPIGAPGATGALVPPRDPESLARAIKLLLGDERLRRELGENAAADARARFDSQRQADDYLSWYAELVERSARPPNRSSTSD